MGADTIMCASMLKWWEHVEHVKQSVVLANYMYNGYTVAMRDLPNSMPKPMGCGPEGLSISIRQIFSGHGISDNY